MVLFTFYISDHRFYKSEKHAKIKENNFFWVLSILFLDQTQNFQLKKHIFRVLLSVFILKGVQRTFLSFFQHILLCFYLPLAFLFFPSLPRTNKKHGVTQNFLTSAQKYSKDDSFISKKGTFCSNFFQVIIVRFDHIF